MASPNTSHFLVIFLLVGLGGQTIFGQPQVTLHGETLIGTASVGEPVGYTFSNIKYATAGRFEDSELNDDLSYLSTTIFPNKAAPLCVQNNKTVTPWTAVGNTAYDEDCLFLDIYLPRGQFKTALPVFMWSWGSLFTAGGRGRPGAGATLAKALDAIVVIPQFRVGPFGYLSTSDSFAPGNYALSDMKNAFRWVYENIAKFGGKNDRITLAGHGDAATLISALHIDRSLSAKVFATITMSGSVLQPSAIVRTPLESAKLLAKKAGCADSLTNEKLVECLKEKDADKLQDWADSMQPAAPLAPYFALVKDKKHINGEPEDLLRGYEKTGYTNRYRSTGGFVHQFLKDDGSVVAYMAFGKPIAPVPAINFPGRPNMIIGGKLPEYATSVGGLIGPTVSQTLGCTQVKAKTSAYIALKYGIKNDGDAGADARRAALFRLITDVNYKLPTIKEALIYRQTGAAKGGNVVAMMSVDNKISDVSPATDKTPGLGAYFTCDLGYSLAGQMSYLHAGRPDAKATEAFQDLYKNIAKYGYKTTALNFDPTYRDYIELGEDRNWVGKQFDKASSLDMVQFWDDLKKLNCAEPTAAMMAAVAQ